MKMDGATAAPQPIEEAENILVERVKNNDREAFGPGPERIISKPSAKQPDVAYRNL
jgi:hypothetical protein